MNVVNSKMMISTFLGYFLTGMRMRSLELDQIRKGAEGET